MGDHPEIDDQELEQKNLAFEQSLQYARDLARIYQVEKARRKELETDNASIRAVIDSMNDGMIATDIDRMIVEVNQVCCKIFETEKAALVGQRLDDLLDVPAFAETVAPLTENRQPHIRFEFDLSRPLKRSLLASASRIAETGGYVFVLHDISARKRAENLKNEFVAILSHELRTPLNAILGFSDLLDMDAQENFSPEQQEYISLIRQAGKNMLHIVQELLDFADARRFLQDHEHPPEEVDGACAPLIADTAARDFHIFNQTVNLIAVAEEAALKVKDKADARGIGIQLRLPSSTPRIVGHPAMLRDMLVHLLQNGIQFGKDDGTVWIRLAETEENAEITVTDDGVGMPGTELEKVFDSFYQVEEHMTCSAGGLGLGLPIARHIVSIHGGTIDMQSRLDQGTIVQIRLPKEGHLTEEE